jgi:hypothetical protein
MPQNKEALLNCAISWYRLVERRAKDMGWKDNFGEYFERSDSDVRRIEDYLRLAMNADLKNAEILCVFAQFMEKIRDFDRAEGDLHDYILILFVF